MMTALPDFEPALEEVSLPADWDMKYAQTALFPPIKTLPDRALVVDAWVDRDGNKRGVAWRRANHPNLDKLPSNAPRAVKSLFTADGQLSYIRGDYDRVPRALDGWSEYRVLSVELPALKERIRIKPAEEHQSENFDWSPSGVLWRNGARYGQFMPA